MSYNKSQIEHRGKSVLYDTRLQVVYQPLHPRFYHYRSMLHYRQKNKL